MALDFIPRGDLKNPHNVGAEFVKTWPIKNIKVPTQNSGGGTQMASKGVSGGPPSNQLKPK